MSALRTVRTALASASTLAAVLAVPATAGAALNLQPSGTVSYGAQAPTSLVAADMNGDGRPDLVGTVPIVGRVLVMINATPLDGLSATYFPSSADDPGSAPIDLAVADVNVLSQALNAFYKENRTDLLDRYSETALKRIWRAEHFSYWMTSMMHRIEGASAFEQQLQVAELEYVTTSRTAATVLAENYVGVAGAQMQGML